MSTEPTTTRLPCNAVVIRHPVDVFFTMVQRPDGEWMRVGRPHSTREAARGWLPIVKGQWRFCKTSIRKLTVRFKANGDVTEATKRRLDCEFNMDPPTRG